MLPAGKPPHREGVCASEHRLNMLHEACGEYPELIIDDREVRRQSSSLSLITCREYRAEYPDAKLFWCMGSDAFALFHTWHKWQEILSLVNIAVIDRPDSAISAHSEVWQHLDSNMLATQVNAHAGSVVCLNLTKIDLSSSQIRAQLKANQQPIFGLPEAVRHYIINHKLYSQ